MLSLVISQNALTIILILAAIALVIGISFYLAKKRTAALQKAASELGFSFENSGADFLKELDPHLHLLQQGRMRTASNIMRGPAGEAFFDYSYQVGVSAGPGTQSRSYSQTVAAFHFPVALLPEFQLGPESIVLKMAAALGYKIIRFETHPQFARRFILRGADESAVRIFFLPPLLDYFQSVPEKSTWNVEGAGQWLLIYHARKKIKPAELRSFIDASSAIARGIAQAAALGAPQKTMTKTASRA